MEPDIGIVLSGGGLYLYAHVGVLEALEDAGLLNDHEQSFTQHDRVRAVIGTSAGSLVGSYLAAGYPPHEIWKLSNWRIWGAPVDNLSFQRLNAIDSGPGRRDLSQILDIDWDGLATGVLHNLNRFKGFIGDRQLVDRLSTFHYIPASYQNYRDPHTGQPLYRNPEYQRLLAAQAILEPAHRPELYIIASNISNGRETVFHFAEQMGSHARDPLLRASLALAVEPALGREQQYALYLDSHVADLPVPYQMTIPDAVRCSISIPGVFRPYYRKTRIFHGSDANMLGAYYEDGGVRDNFSLSVAAKVAGCRHLFGIYLGNPGYEFQLAGQTSLATLLYRTVDQLMMQTIYEADQDDAVITRMPVRTVIPPLQYLTTSQGAFLDPKIAVFARRAGYIAGAYLLFQVDRALHPSEPTTPEAFADFTRNLLHRRQSPPAGPLVTWDDIFSPQIESTVLQQIDQQERAQIDPQAIAQQVSVKHIRPNVAIPPTGDAIETAQPAAGLQEQEQQALQSRYYTFSPTGDTGITYYDQTSAIFAEFDHPQQSAQSTGLATTEPQTPGFFDTTFKPWLLYLVLGVPLPDTRTSRPAPEQTTDPTVPEPKPGDVDDDDYEKLGEPLRREGLQRSVDSAVFAFRVLALLTLSAMLFTLLLVLAGIFAALSGSALAPAWIAIALVLSLILARLAYRFLIAWAWERLQTLVKSKLIGTPEH